VFGFDSGGGPNRSGPGRSGPSAFIVSTRGVSHPCVRFRIKEGLVPSSLPCPS